MQAHILYVSRIEIPSLVGNFELKTWSQGGDLWTEILSQGLGSFTPNFWFDQSPHPIPWSPPPSGITLIAALDMTLPFNTSFRLKDWKWQMQGKKLNLAVICF